MITTFNIVKDGDKGEDLLSAFLPGRTGANVLRVSQGDSAQTKGVCSLTAKPVRCQDSPLGWAVGVSETQGVLPWCRGPDDPLIFLALLDYL